MADDDDTHVPVVGERYPEAGRGRQGAVGEAPAVLASMADLVAFARAYFEETLGG